MIVIVDFGSQTTHLIGRRVRDFGVDVNIIDPEDALRFAQSKRPAGIILSGGPSSVYEKGAPMADKRIFNLGIPILGICYGQQLTAHLLPGGITKKDKQREDGPAQIFITNTSILFKGLPESFNVWMSHGDTVVKAPYGFEFTAHSSSIQSAAMQNTAKNIYGVQFHPEVEHTEHGILILRNFLEKVCTVKTSKKSIDIKRIISAIKKEVGNKNVIAAVSGGVDSTVASVLVAKAIGKQLTVIYCDNGMMRVGTREEVDTIFRKRLRIPLIIIDCKTELLKALKGVTDPESKRKIIGKQYIDIFEKEAREIKGVTFLVQGTIYSDVIESKGTKHAAKIKSHHNVGGLPEYMKLQLIEPLRTYYKDEVRLIGKALGLPEFLINKQPFPGPGQAIRIIGEVTEERLKKQQMADAIVLEEINNAGLYEKVFQSFSILTGCMSTAVKGDGRFYGEVVALRIYDSSDIMSASWSRVDYAVLQRIVSRITNEVPGVSRVVYDITTKPPATMEWE